MISFADIVRRVAMIAAMAAAVVGIMRLVAGPDMEESQELALRNQMLPATREARIAAMASRGAGRDALPPVFVNALDPGLSLASTSDAGSSFDPVDDYWGLPRSEGVETVAAYCGACHSMAVVMQQRQTKEGWDYLLTWMSEKQGMVALDAETREEVLAYLTREFAQR